MTPLEATETVRRLRALANVDGPTFRDLFKELDEHLSNGGQFPRQWITPDNQIQLKYDAITAGLRTEPVSFDLNASCGHPPFGQTTYCSRPYCSNHIRTAKNSERLLTEFKEG